MKFLVSLSFIVFVFAGTVDGQSSIPNAIERKAGGIPYLLSTPDGYDAARAYPTIIFLHGGDRSNTKHHPAKYASKAGLDFPFIVIAPSCTGGCSWGSVDLAAILQDAQSEVSIDNKRIYLTGYSMGGAGTWSQVRKIGSHLAAAVPMAPAGGSEQDLCQLKELPIRVYHGTADYGYERSRRIVEKLKDCGSTSAELISLEGKGHGIWPAILSGASYYQWLLDQTK